ncbi:MAG TPA: tetratricopeptide repeat protein [Nitrospira sp.]|nr:tetratricopeptide repeat protein [Nitrospira sp.]
MPSKQKDTGSAIERDRLAVQLAKDPQSKVFLPLAEEYCKAGMWQEAALVLEDGLKYYPGFITAMVVLGRAYDQLGQSTKAKAILEEAVKLSPENLRAHRTLIKIYTAQGLTQEALKSCEVILSVHARDEEALSVVAKLGGFAKAPGEASAPPRSGKSVQLPRQSEPTSVAVEARRNPEVVEKGEELPAESSAAKAGSTMDTAIQSSSPFPDETKGTDQSQQSTSSAASAPGDAETIHRLESWLRLIQRERRDRHASDGPSSTISQ